MEEEGYFVAKLGVSNTKIYDTYCIANLGFYFLTKNPNNLVPFTDIIS